jgi:hypothetical protein
MDDAGPFGFVDGTIHTTPELTAEDRDAELFKQLQDALSPLGFTLTALEHRPGRRHVVHVTVRSGWRNAA